MTVKLVLKRQNMQRFEGRVQFFILYFINKKNAIKKSFNKILKLTKLKLNQGFSMASH